MVEWSKLCACGLGGQCGLGGLHIIMRSQYEHITNSAAHIDTGSKLGNLHDSVFYILYSAVFMERERERERETSNKWRSGLNSVLVDWEVSVDWVVYT